MTSIRDIAKMAGVSAASVSRILNNDLSFSINPETKKRVIEIANQLHYAKDKNKHGVRSPGDDLTLALILRHSERAEMDDPYFREIRQGIEKEAAKWRLKTLVAFRMRDEKRDLTQLSKYGAVIMIGEMTPDALAEIASYNKKLILVERKSKNLPYDTIQTDFASKTFEIMDELAARGHTRIGFVGGFGSRVDRTGQSRAFVDEVRASSYLSWMKLHNHATDIVLKQGKWGPQDGLELGREIIAEKNRPTALVVASDPMAVGVYKAINEAGLKIPEDIAVVSFDDIEMARYMTPALSSVSMNANEMGRLAVKIARERVLNSELMPMRIVCASQLHLRESVKTLKKV